MTVVERIHEDTQALPFAIFVETEDDIKPTNMSSRVTPTLVSLNILQSSCAPFDRPCQLSVQILRFTFREEDRREVMGAELDVRPAPTQLMTF